MSRKIIALVLAVVIVFSVTFYYMIANSGYFVEIHDVAVTHIATSQTSAYVGDILNITVSASNEGTRFETFSVTLFYDSTVIGMHNVTNLQPFAETDLAFSWNTSEMPPNNFQIKAQASPVAKESNTTNNVCDDGVVMLRSRPTGKARLHVDPPSIVDQVGDSFTINLNVSDVADLCSWDAYLHWNTTILNATRIIEGPFLKDQGNTFFVGYMDSQRGYASFHCELESEGPGIDGNGILASVQFQARQSGNCELSLNQTSLSNSLNEVMEHDVFAGHVSTIP